MDIEVLGHPDEDYGPPNFAEVRATLADVPVIATALLVQEGGGGGGDLKPWEIRELKIEHKTGGPITSTLLRRIPVAEVLSEALRAINPVMHFGFSKRDIDAAMERGPDPETLRLVAKVYEAARLQRGNPVAEVVDVFTISRSTATRWVRKAVDAGYIVRLAREGVDDDTEA